jgi:two-component system sensor histidine kinase KdpD
VRFLVPLTSVVVATLMARVLGVDATVSALLLLLAVVLASLYSPISGVLAALLGGLSLNLVFFEPAARLSLATSDEVVSLTVFLVVAVLVGALVSRDRASRRQAQLGQLEAHLRIDISNRLLRSEPTGEVVQTAAREIARIYDLAACTLTTAGITAEATRPLRPGRTVLIHTDEATVKAVTSAGSSFNPAAEDLLASLTSALGLVFVRAELERAASDARVDAEVNRARAAFFAAAGHNLRTPLTSVSASVSALIDSGDVLDDNEQAQLLETIRDETARLERMVAKVLSQTLIRGADIVPEPEPVDLGGMVQVAIGRLGPHADAKRIELQLPPEVGPLWLDVTMLEQILLNLLENAVRFAPDGSIITVSAEQSGSHVDLRVVDHGPGVDPAEREAIFNEFHRSGSRTEGEGTGLGLAIVAALVSAHNGEAWCEATPGGGATFVVRFPLGEPALGGLALGEPALDEPALDEPAALPEQHDDAGPG